MVQHVKKMRVVRTQIIVPNSERDGKSSRKIKWDVETGYRIIIKKKGSEKVGG